MELNFFTININNEPNIKKMLLKDNVDNLEKKWIDLDFESLVNYDGKKNNNKQKKTKSKSKNKKNY